MLNTLEGFSILYAEDEPAIRSDVSEYLASYFRCVHVAADGAEALEYYTTHRPEVVMLDIHLPYIDGIEVAREIRRQDPGVKILMLTAHAEQETLLKATELKLTKYLLKPITPRRFKEAMEQLAEELAQHSDRFVRLGPSCIWDRENRRLLHRNHPIDLSDKEERLLAHLIRQPGATVSYADIMVAVWEDAYEREISLDSVKNQVSKLRKKLPEGSLESVYGVGYRLKTASA
jgi:DNA-binding response OmpR family regulator